MFGFVFIILCYIIVPLFSNKKQKGADLDGKGSREVLGKVEGKGRETAIRL